MTFEDLKSAWTWRPIANCPGRFVLAAPQRAITPQNLLGPLATFREYTVSSARDVVIVSRFEDGGLLSYRQPSGAYVHTLNTREGFARKLAQLGIAPTTD